MSISVCGLTPFHLDFMPPEETGSTGSTSPLEHNTSRHTLTYRTAGGTVAQEQPRSYLIGVAAAAAAAAAAVAALVPAGEPGDGFNPDGCSPGGRFGPVMT